MSRPTGRGVLAWALLAPHVALAQARPAPDAAPSLALQWNDKEGLAPTTQQDFERRLSERLGRRAFEPTAKERALSVSWLGNQENCRVELHLVRGPELEGTRLLQSPHSGCAGVLPALLTVSALLLIESESAPEAAEVSAPAPASPVAPRPDSRMPPAPSPPRRSRSRLMLTFGGALASGLAPRTELGPSASLLVLPAPTVRVGARISGYLSRGYGAAPGMSLAHQSAALFACIMPFASRVSLGLCASGTLHRFSSQGLYLSRPRREHSYAWTAGVAGRGEWQLTEDFWWVAAAGPELATSPLDFYFTRADARDSSLFTQKRVSLAVWTGLAVRLP